MRRLRALLCVAFAACSGGPSTAEAAREGEAHAERFEALERWALRAVAAETIPASVEAFEARIFAPMDGDRAIVDAWIARTGTAPFAASAHGTHAPLDDDALTHVRVPDHGAFRIGFLELDDPRTTEVDPRRVVLVERTTRRSPTESISFAVAFDRP